MSDVYNQNEVNASTNVNNPNDASMNNQMYQSSPYQTSPYPNSGAEAYAYAKGTYNQNPANSTPYVGESTETVNLGDEISTKKYNMIIGFTLLWGFFFNYLTVTFVDPVAFLNAVGGMFYIIYFGLALTGIFIFKKSSNPAVSFLGYNLLVLLHL